LEGLFLRQGLGFAPRLGPCHCANKPWERVVSSIRIGRMMARFAGVVVAGGSLALCVAGTGEAATYGPDYQVPLHQPTPITAAGFGTHSGQCGSIPNTEDGWHFVLPGDFTVFVSLTVTFSPGGSQTITSFGPPTRQACVRGLRSRSGARKRLGDREDGDRQEEGLVVQPVPHLPRDSNADADRLADRDGDRLADRDGDRLAEPEPDVFHRARSGTYAGDGHPSSDGLKRREPMGGG
jgi:hypothetical protein